MFCRIIAAVTHTLFALCPCFRRVGSGCVSREVRDHESSVWRDVEESWGVRTRSLRQRLAASLPALFPAACCHGNVCPTGSAETGSCPHHHICVWQVRLEFMSLVFMLCFSIKTFMCCFISDWFIGCALCSGAAFERWVSASLSCRFFLCWGQTFTSSAQQRGRRWCLMLPRPPQPRPQN